MKKLLIPILFICTSCAKMINGSHQTIHLDHLPQDTLVIVSNDDGSKIATTQKLSLARSSPYTVEIRRVGHETKTIAITRSLSPLVLTYVLPGGLVMMGIDATSSSQFNLNPERINAKLTQAEILIDKEDTETAALLAFKSIIKAASILRT